LEGQSLFSEAMNQASPEFPSMDRGVRLTSVALFVQVFFGARNECRNGSMRAAIPRRIAMKKSYGRSPVE
jgi:hypothetical protein